MKLECGHEVVACPSCGASTGASTGATASATTGASSGASGQLAHVVALEAVPTAKASPKRQKYEDPWFQRFWEVYPRRIAKKPAYKAFQRAIRDGASPSAIIEAAQAFAYAAKRKGIELRYLPYPATWLNDERWNDEPDQIIFDAPKGPDIGSAEWQAERDADYERIKREFA